MENARIRGSCAGCAWRSCNRLADRPFLELALTAGADALLTGDRDLLVLADVFPVPILMPAAFRQCLRDPSIENDIGED